MYIYIYIYMCVSCTCTFVFSAWTRKFDWSVAFWLQASVIFFLRFLTMLMPPRAISAGDEDDLAPTRASGFRIKVVPGQRVTQLFSAFGTIPLTEIRLYSFQDGQVIPASHVLSDLPPHVSVQTWSSTLADQLEDGLRSMHVPMAPDSVESDFRRFSIRDLSPWHHLTVAVRISRSCQTASSLWSHKCSRCVLIWLAWQFRLCHVRAHRHLCLP